MNTRWKVSRSMALIAHPIGIALIAVPTVLAAKHKREVGSRIGVALPLGVLASKLVKRRWPRHKPRLLTITPHESMPSGHSVATVAFAASLVDARRAWAWAPLGVAAVAFVNWCRVRDREHRLSEVLVGDAIGLAASVVAGIAARALVASPPPPHAPTMNAATTTRIPSSLRQRTHSMRPGSQLRSRFAL